MAVWIGLEIEIEVDTDATAVFRVSTELPANDITVKRTISFDTTDTTTGRRIERFKLRNTTKWQLIKFEFIPTGIAKLYSGRIFAKRLGVQDQWQWYPLPIKPTPEGWSESALPIPVTPEQYTETALPIAATPEGYKEASIPIPQTPEQYQEKALPIPVTPEGYQEAQLPIAITPEAYREYPLPLPHAPPDPQWVEIPAGD